MAIHSKTDKAGTRYIAVMCGGAEAPPMDDFASADPEARNWHTIEEYYEQIEKMKASSRRHRTIDKLSQRFWRQYRHGNGGTS